jgi:SAM-dependent methyltransferase
MHQSSFEHMQAITQKYLLENTKGRIVADIGSYDVNGSYKPIFKDHPGRYIGVDLAAGPNVDVVLNSPYRLPFDSFSLDVVISGQAFEHVEYFWLTWLEIARVVKPGGLVFLIAPSRGPEHRFPQDCWRFYPDAYRALANYAAMELLEVSTDWEPHADPDSAPWGDTVGVFRQPDLSFLQRSKRRLMQQLRYRIMPGFSG